VSNKLPTLRLIIGIEGWPFQVFAETLTNKRFSFIYRDRAAQDSSAGFTLDLPALISIIVNVHDLKNTMNLYQD